jgi:tetratricopeptide (TPR) repeat protein
MKGGRRLAWAVMLACTAILFTPYLAAAQGQAAKDYDHPLNGPNPLTDHLGEASAGIGVAHAGDKSGRYMTNTGLPQAGYDPQIEYSNGLTDLEFGCYIQAREDFRHVLSVAPKTTRAWFLMGVAYNSSGDRAGAAGAYQKAVQIDPQMIDAQRELAVTLALQGQAEKAKPILAQLKTLAGACSGGCADAELLKTSVGRVEAALSGQLNDVMRPTAASAVCSAVATTAARSCFAAAKFGDLHGNGAEACSRALSSALPDEVKVRLLVDRGVIRLSDNKPKAAIEDFDAAIAMNGQIGDAFTNKGTAELSLKQYEQARADIDKGIAIGSAEPQRAWFNRAIADEHLGDAKAAYLDYLKASMLDPSWPAPKAELTRFAMEMR